MTEPVSAFDPVEYKSTTRARFEDPCELVVAVGAN